ncbi:MAG: ABC transporter substrate-binding protein [Cyanobacteria bacterium REEB417]|nr:ABC transporter substrate-binding protein [Cyanobacteria bacterium REEB417]
MPQPGTLLLGQSAPLSGPAAQLGREYRDGALAWFAEVNRRGGIHGRRIRLVSLDDRYEPVLTQRNTTALLERWRVLALFGYVGTPTVKAVLPELRRRGVPLVAPLTGAALLRNPTPTNVINLRASYALEVDRIVAALVRAGSHQIAVMVQNDAFGADGLAAARQALARHGLKPVALASMARNSTDGAAAARTIAAANPNAVVVVTAYPSAAAFGLEMQRRHSKAQLMNVSFVGTRGLQDALVGGKANGIGIAQVVPFPWDRRIPVVAEYQRLLQRQNGATGFGFNSLEGFLAAKLMTEALQRAGADPTRQQLLKAFGAIGQLDLGGFRIDLGPNDRNASDLVELTYLGSQRWEP